MPYVNKNLEKLILLFGTIVCFSLSVYVCANLKMDSAPDEYGRYILTRWFYNNLSLPYGNEPEIIIEEWGFSYAYRPYLFQLFSALNMNVASLLGFCSESSLLFSARLVSAFSYAGLFAVMYLIGGEISYSIPKRLFLSVSVVCVPQIVFLSGYINNDIPSLFSSALILLFWIQGSKNAWNLKSCICLGISIGLCASSYYNAYAFIFCSILVYFHSVAYADERIKKIDTKHIIIGALLIFGIAFLIAGWYFVRNYVIYSGDIFGLRTQNEAWRKNAVGIVRPETVFNLQNSGLNLWDYLMYGRGNWFITTFRSIIGMFGYMDVLLPKELYAFYGLFWFSGLLALIGTVNKSSFSRFDVFIGVVLIVTPVFLSIYYSCTCNYQPQGRYIISALPPLIIAVTEGFGLFEKRINLIARNRLGSFLMLLLPSTEVVLCFYSVFSVMKEHCF